LSGAVEKPASMETEAFQLEKQFKKKSASGSDGQEMAQGTSDVAKCRKELLNERLVEGWHDKKQTSNNGKK
jgi:hypothetical protein